MAFLGLLSLWNTDDLEIDFVWYLLHKSLGELGVEHSLEVVIEHLYGMRGNGWGSILILLAEPEVCFQRQSQDTLTDAGWKLEGYFYFSLFIQLDVLLIH